MCRTLDRMFRECRSTRLNQMETRWVKRLQNSYADRGHLSSRQFEVLRDIHSRNRSSSGRPRNPSHYQG